MEELAGGGLACWGELVGCFAGVGGFMLCEVSVAFEGAEGAVEAGVVGASEA